MISSIEIRNFQSHKKSELVLSPGVNVIRGDSHSGKSSVVRALKWALENRPQGFDFRSTFADRGEVTSVAVEFDDGQWVIRQRDPSKTNNYLVSSSDEPLEALRADVPSEVRHLFSMDYYNVQGQYDSFFLLDDSTPGEVARKLSEIVGLDEIDRVLKRVNQIVRDADNLAKTAGEEIDKLAEELGAMPDLDFIGRKLDKLERLLAERKVKREERRELLAVCREIEDAERKVEEIEGWLEIEKDADPLFRMASEIKDLTRKRADLAEALEELKGIEDNVKECERAVRPESAIRRLKEDIQEHKRWLKETRELRELASSLEKVQAEIERLDDEAKGLETEKQKIMKEYGICPLCGRMFKDG